MATSRIPRIDLIGKTISNFTIVELAAPDSGRIMWRCRCSCGNERVLRQTALLQGRPRQCSSCHIQQIGAGNKRHGHSVGYHRSPEHRVWSNMCNRCHNPNNPKYPRYGGRGISVCERWLDFANFLADMGLRPSAQHTIERKNNNGDYEPGNCCWATWKQQARNTSRCLYLEFAGKRQTATEWSAETGIGYPLLLWRIHKGWGTERALTTPVRIHI